MTHDPAPDVNASTYRAKAAHDADLRPAPILTPGQALAAAAVLEVYGPHHSRMAAIIQALRDYADEARVIPSDGGIDGTLDVALRTPPEGAGNTYRGLTTATSTDSTGRP